MKRINLTPPNPEDLIQIRFEQTRPDVSWYRHRSWPPGEYKRFRHAYTMSQNIDGFEFFNEKPRPVGGPAPTPMDPKLKRFLRTLFRATRHLGWTFKAKPSQLEPTIKGYEFLLDEDSFAIYAVYQTSGTYWDPPDWVEKEVAVAWDWRSLLKVVLDQELCILDEGPPDDIDIDPKDWA